jgi:hypothetical protein
MGMLTQRLLATARTGDRQTFDRLFRRHRSALRRFGELTKRGSVWPQCYRRQIAVFRLVWYARPDSLEPIYESLMRKGVARQVVPWPWNLVNKAACSGLLREASFFKILDPGNRFLRLAG